MVSLTKSVWSPLPCISTSDGGASTSSPALMMRRVGGTFTTGVRCNPEIGVGLLAATAEPPSSYLQIANKPIHTGVHGIMTMAADLCCNSVCTSVNKGMMFCTRGCRFDFFMEALYQWRYMELTGLPTGNQINATMRKLLVSEEEEESFRKTFFTR